MTNFAEMHDDELVAELERAGHSPNPDLVEEMLARRETLAPALLAVFADSFEDDWLDNDDPRWYRGIQAGRILLHWREEAALPLFDKLYRRGGTDIEWFEDRVALYGPPALPVFRNILFMETDDDWHFGQAMATSVLEQIAHNDPETRQEVLDALQATLPELLEDGTPDWPEDQEPGMIWSSAADCLANLRDESSRDTILALFDADLMDETVMTRNDYLLALKEGNQYIRSLSDYDMMQEIQRDWEVEQTRQRRLAREAARPQARPAPVRDAQVKVGRNEPCPCGSGRKYKHCCGKKR